MQYVFGDYSLDPVHYELRQAGTLVPLEPRVFDLLAYLVQHPGKSSPQRRCWSSCIQTSLPRVERLTNCVAQARKALHDTSQTQQYIQEVADGATASPPPNASSEGRDGGRGAPRHTNSTSSGQPRRGRGGRRAASPDHPGVSGHGRCGRGGVPGA